MRLNRIWLLLVGLVLLFLIQAGGIAWSQVTERVSVDTTGSDADSASSNPSTSSNGSYVAFQSDATNLMGVGNDNNGVPDIFADDLQAGAGGGGESSSGGGGCFIATAADGSGMAGEVK